MLPALAHLLPPVRAFLQSDAEMLVIDTLQALRLALELLVEPLERIAQAAMHSIGQRAKAEFGGRRFGYRPLSKGL